MESSGTIQEVPAKGGICGPKCPTRYCIVVMLSIGMGLIYGHKVALHVAIVSMVNHTGVRELGGEDDDEPVAACGKPGNSSESKPPDGPFIWPNNIVGYLLSSYFYGYLISEFPGGYFSEKFSARWVFFFSVLLNIVCHLLTPIISGLHWAGLLVLRIGQGIGGGMTFPASHVLIAHWVPPAERSFLGNIVYAGTCLGTVIFMLASGWIASAFRWEYVFYIEGGASVLWLIMWAILSADSPRKQKRITPEERAFIADSLLGETHHGEHPPIPWKSIFKSKPFWAILVAHTCGNWGWYMVLVELPQYMVHALGYNVRQNTVLSAMPFFIMFIFSMILSKTLQFLKSKNIISITWLRKIATLIASVVPAICLGVLCYDSCNQRLALIMMTVAITAIGGMFSGFLANHIDIAPNFAGTLMAITNSVATIPGILVPTVVGILTKADPTIRAWTTIFYITIALYVVEIIVYTILGSGEVREWNKVPE